MCYYIRYPNRISSFNIGFIQLSPLSVQNFKGFTKKIFLTIHKKYGELESHFFPMVQRFDATFTLPTEKGNVAASRKKCTNQAKNTR